MLKTCTHPKHRCVGTPPKCVQDAGHNFCACEYRVRRNAKGCKSLPSFGTLKRRRSVFSLREPWCQKINVLLYMGVSTGGRGAFRRKVEDFSVLPFFSKISCRRRGFVIPFRNLQEMAVSESYAFGGKVAIFFRTRPELFWRFGVCSNSLVSSGVVCIQGFMLLRPVLKHVVTMANFGAMVNDADFYAESTREGPTLQLNDEVFMAALARRSGRGSDVMKRVVDGPKPLLRPTDAAMEMSYCSTTRVQEFLGSVHQSQKWRLTRKYMVVKRRLMVLLINDTESDVAMYVKPPG